jgi:hypothetical protein
MAAKLRTTSPTNCSRGPTSSQAATGYSAPHRHTDFANHLARTRGTDSPQPALVTEGEFIMGDEFIETDVPTEADLDQAYGSRYLSANDIGDRRIRTKIVKVRKEDIAMGDGHPQINSYKVIKTTIQALLRAN